MKFKKFLIALLEIITAAGIGVLLGARVFKDTSMSFLLMLFVVILGAIVGMYLHIIVHELGHLIAGKKNGFTFVSFTIGSLCFENKNGELALSFKKSPGGMTKMYPGKDVSKEQFVNFIKGGLYGSLVFTIIFLLLDLLPLFIDVAPYLYSSYCCIFPISLGILLNNTLNANAKGAMTDGAFIYNFKHGTPQGDILLEINKYQGLLNAGIKTVDIEEDLFKDLAVIPDDDPIAPILYSNELVYYSDKQDNENIKRVCQKLEDCLPYASPMYLNDLNKDLFIGNLYLGDEEKAVSFYSKIKFDKKVDAFDYYLMAIYESKINKDIDKASEYKAKAIALIPYYPIKGVADALAEKIEQA